MDTILRKIVNLNKPQTHNVFTRDPNGDELKYTSLRDILPQLPTTKGAITNHDHSFVDSANISISNQLVKQAASAYLQSAAILASRNESFPGSLWEEARSSATFHSIWRKYVVNPLKACMKFITRPICWIAKCMGNRICL